MAFVLALFPMSILPSYQPLTGTSDGNFRRMLHAVLNKSWKKHPIKQQLHSHLPLISKNILLRWISHVGNCWRSKNKLRSDIFSWTPKNGHTNVGGPARTYLHQFYTDTRCSLEDLLGAMDNRDGWRERVRELSAISMA